MQRCRGQGKRARECRRTIGVAFHGKEGHRRGMEKQPKGDKENRKWGKLKGTEGRGLEI